MLCFRVMTLVIAWRIVVPAFSMSFFERAIVMQTFRAGMATGLVSLGLMAWLKGCVFRRVIKTPFASVYKSS